MVTATNSSELMVTWTSPECRYGVLDRYILYYMEGDTPQTTPIRSDGYTSVDIDSDMEEYNITGLTPFTVYLVHVQAVVVPAAGGRDLFGDVDVEVATRTYSAVDEDIPTPPPTTAPIDPPTSNEVVYLIGDPQSIDTGRVM